MDGVGDKIRDWLTWALEDQLRRVAESLIMPGESPDLCRDDQILVSSMMGLNVEITLDPEEGPDRYVFHLTVGPDGTGSLSYGPWSMPLGRFREADLSSVAELAVRGSPVLEVMCT